MQDAWTDGATVDAPGMADPKVANEAWIDTVRVAEAKGLQTRTRPARTKRDYDLARRQNVALSRRMYGMPEGYERIFRRDQ